MLRLEKVTGKNVWDILKLEVLDDQKHFVAGNDTSIIEAYIAITGNGHAFPFGIYEGDTPDGIELCVGGPRASEYSRHMIRPERYCSLFLHFFGVRDGKLLLYYTEGKA